MSKLMEYALGRDPLGTDSSSSIQSSIMKVEGQELPCFFFNRPSLGANASEVVYLPKQRSTLDK